MGGCRGIKLYGIFLSVIAILLIQILVQLISIRNHLWAIRFPYEAEEGFEEERKALRSRSPSNSKIRGL